MKAFIRIAAINLLVLGGLVASLEISAVITRSIWQSFKPKPPNRFAFQLSPSTGHTHFESKGDTSTPLPFVSLSTKADCTSCPHLNILVLGGSTSDPHGIQYSGFEGTWPHHLSSILLERGLSTTIDNYAQGGFNSSQELISLIKATTFNKYDLVIQLTGINEYYFVRNSDLLFNPVNAFSSDLFLKSSKLHKLLYDGDKYFACKTPFCFFLNYKSGLSSLFDFVSVKLQFVRESSLIGSDAYHQPEYTSVRNSPSSMLYAQDIYTSNLRKMSYLLNDENIRFYSILQPTMFIEDPSPQIFSNRLSLESALAELFPLNDNIKILSSFKVDYLYTFSTLYGFLKSSCSELPFCTDASTLLVDPSINYFTDPRHPNSKGNYRTALFVADKITSDYQF